MVGLSGDEMYRPEISKPLVKVVTSASSSPVRPTRGDVTINSLLNRQSFLWKLEKITHLLDKSAWSDTNIGTFDQTHGSRHGEGHSVGEVSGECDRGGNLDSLGMLCKEFLMAEEGEVNTGYVVDILEVPYSDARLENIEILQQGAASTMEQQYQPVSQLVAARKSHPPCQKAMTEPKRLLLDIFRSLGRKI